MSAIYQIGDVLQVKSIEEIINEYGDYDDDGHINGIKGGFNRSMEYMCGKVFTVKSIDDDGPGYYRSKEGIENERYDSWGSHWYISGDMLKPYEAEVNLVDVDELSFFDLLEIGE